MRTRYFEYVGHGSDKFWEVTYPEGPLDGTSTWTCRWGRRGTTGQSKSFYELTWINARWRATAKIHEKESKGYVEINPASHAILMMPQPQTIVKPTKQKYQAQQVPAAAIAAPSGKRAFDLE
jgi:predicted DNA-binding WGR domain protein